MVTKARKEKSGQQGSLIVCWAAEQTVGTTKEIPVAAPSRRDPPETRVELEPSGSGTVSL
jgi:hypothetical protein